MLSSWLVSELFAVFLVFCRVGSAIMLLPGFGETYVSTRFRLLLAVCISFVAAPAIAQLPPMPTGVPQLMVMMLGEVLVGLFIGSLCKFIMHTVSIAGTVISLQANLASLMTTDVTQIQGQAQVLSNFLSMSALVLVFAANLHHGMLHAIIDSYRVFLPGLFPSMGDISSQLSQTLNSAFIMAMQMSAPFIVLGLVMNLGIGLLARLVPNVQAFFVMTAPQILFSFFLLMVMFSSMMYWFLEFFKDTLASFIAS